eukprot:1866798-Rhodomonas_salina.1
MRAGPSGRRAGWRGGCQCRAPLTPAHQRPAPWPAWLACHAPAPARHVRLRVRVTSSVRSVRVCGGSQQDTQRDAAARARRARGQGGDGPE